MSKQLGLSQDQPIGAGAETMVMVQRAWNDWRTAMVRIGDLDDIHWFQPSGAPRPLLHASVRCSHLISGDIPHDCSGTPAPHSLLVCVLKSHTPPAVFEQLARRADEHGKPFRAPVSVQSPEPRVPVRSSLHRALL